MMPNTPYFVRLRETRSRAASLSRTATDPIIPPAANSLVTSNVLHHSGLDPQYAMYFQSDDGSSGEYPIGKLLDVLHAKYPAFDYPQYEKPLKNLGVHYLITASIFDATFYIMRVGMVVGAAHMFCQCVAKEMHQVKLDGRGKGRPVHVAEDGEKENFEP